MSRELARKSVCAPLVGGLLLMLQVSMLCASEGPLIVYHGEQAVLSKASWPEEALAKRFEFYWSTFQKGERETCYNAEAPHFRYLHPQDRYGAYWSVATKLPLERVEVFSIQQKAPFFVEVPMYLVKKDVNGHPVKVGMKDRWIKVSGQWYHLLRDPIVFPGS